MPVKIIKFEKKKKKKNKCNIWELNKFSKI